MGVQAVGEEMTLIWALIPGPIRRALAWLLAGAVAVLGIFYAGKREASQAAKKATLEGTVKAMKDRERIDHEIDQDTDLADRAKRSGVVRPDK